MPRPPPRIRLRTTLCMGKPRARVELREWVREGRPPTDADMLSHPRGPEERGIREEIGESA